MTRVVRTCPRQSKHNRMMKAVKYYTKNISAGSCNNVTGILLGGDDAWMPGQSQDMHDQVMNTEAYEY